MRMRITRSAESLPAKTRAASFEQSFFSPQASITEQNSASPTDCLAPSTQADETEVVTRPLLPGAID